MTWDDYRRTMLALTLWREARGEGRDGMRAVGHVIRNRTHAGFGDWDTVITKKWQFSSVSAPGDSQLVLWPDNDNPLHKEKFETAMQLADAIFDGTDPDITGGALYYANLAVVPETSTFWETVVHNPEIVQVAVIGHHTFYAPKPKEAHA